LRAADYKGWDPYDGLNARVFNTTPLYQSRFVRLVWQQVFKRLSINLRGLAMVPKVENAKALSLCICACRARGDEKTADALLERLYAHQNPDGGWGYPFDWQAKAFFVPKGTSNGVVTTYAALALKDGDKRLGQAADFVEENLDCGAYFGYVPTHLSGGQTMVHNASLWAAWVLMRAGRVKKAAPAIQYTLDAQHEAGFWRYGEAAHHQFIDGFHTGYVLETLKRMQDIGLPKGLQKPVANSLKTGTEYYVTHFFEDDGAPKYYHNKRYPIDCHNTAQAVLMLKDSHPKLAAKVLDWTIDNMWDEDKGYFYYQKSKSLTNRINYQRWTQAWMFLALAAAEGRL